MSEGTYTTGLDYLEHLTLREIEDARIRLCGGFPPIEPIEPSLRERSFITERRLVIRQIEQVFRIPAHMFEGRIESSIRLKVVGA